MFDPVEVHESYQGDVRKRPDQAEEVLERREPYLMEGEGPQGPTRREQSQKR